MVRIISDTSTLYSRQQAIEAGFDVSPLSVTINEKSYKEFDEIQPAEFISIIRQGHLPTSSQPAVGDVVALYQKYADDDIINIAMADGLSGTYNGAVAAAELVENTGRIKVINSHTLCGPHRHLVESAVKFAKEGLSFEEIIEKVEKIMASHKSFLMPDDFDYLRRGGRLSPLVSYVGKAIKLAPIMTQTDDGKQLSIAGVRRGFVQAIKHVVTLLEKHGIGNGTGWRVYITHAEVPEKAEKALAIVREAFPEGIFELKPLSPAFITQGGPSCVAVQVIRDKA